MRLKPLERIRFNAGLHITKALFNTRSVVSKPVHSTHASNVPNNTADDINTVIRNEPCSEVYGSLAIKSKSFLSRTPTDIDIVVNNPRNTASIISHKLQQKGHKTNVTYNPEFNSAVVQVSKNGEMVDAVDIHPSNTHYTNYDVHGHSIPPTNVKGINVQTATDQLLRKANSVMSYNDEDKRLGPPDHRRVKDVSDFITTSRLLLDSRQLRAEAELARVQKSRKKLKVWKQHVKGLEGFNPRTTKVGKDPIPEYKEKEFINFAVKNPSINIDDLYFSGQGVKVKKVYKGLQHCIFNQTIRPNKKSKFDIFNFGINNNWTLGTLPRKIRKK